MIPLTVLTYTVPHRKTHDILCGLRLRGAWDVRVVAIPMSYEKRHAPLIEHRPGILWDVDAKTAADSLGYEYREWRYASHNGIEDLTHPTVLIAGANILAKELVESREVINSHPGLLPWVRGLDAVKWAILGGHEVGVTVHRATTEPDAGPVYLTRAITPRPMDTFHSLAMRAYELEISALLDVASGLPEIETVPAMSTISVRTGEEYPVRKRMPHATETMLYRAFEQWKYDQLIGTAEE